MSVRWSTWKICHQASFHPSRHGSIYMHTLFRTRPGRWLKAPWPHANVWRLPVLAGSGSSVSVSHWSYAVSWPSISSCEWGGVGRAIRRGQECCDRSGSTENKMPIGRLHLWWTWWRQTMMTARPYMQKGRLTFTNSCYDVPCEVMLPGIVTLSKL